MTARPVQPAADRISRYAPLILWLLVIFYASTGDFSADSTSRIIRPLLLWLFPDISEERMALAHFITRKVAHFTEYAILGFLAARAFVGSSLRLLRERWILASALLIILNALLDEYHQSFVASRTPSIFDSLIDIAGGLFVLTCLAFFKRPARHIEVKTKRS